MLYALSSVAYLYCASARPLDLDIHLQSFTISHFPSLMIAMAKPAYVAISEYSPVKPVIVFVPSRKQCATTAADLLSYCLADDKEDRFLNIDMEELGRHLPHVTDPLVAENLKHGIGLYHEALDAQDKRIVSALFEANAIQVIVASRVSIFIHSNIS
jgi:pre-mRNA-splicing helicase BRR2